MSTGMSFALADADRAAFLEDGVVCLRDVLDPGEVELLRAAVARQMDALGSSPTGYDFEAMARAVWDPEGRVDAGAATRFDMSAVRGLVDADPDARPLMEAGSSPEPGLFFYDAAGWRADAGIREVAFRSALPGIAAGLLSAERVYFWEDTTFVKAPRTRQKTAFHQDLGYFQIEGDQCLVAWIPLDPAGLYNGVTQYVRGSHRWDEVYAPNIFITQTLFPEAEGPRCPDIEADPGAYDIVSFDVRPGDVILHHVRTVHGAGGNPSGSWRRAVSLRYCGDQVRYLDRKGALPQPGGAGGLRNGDTLDAGDFPVVWPRRDDADAGRSKPVPSRRLGSGL
ncbi:MAG: phytanoyl-CoA dioxygenase family protein [Hyphomonas sp.]